MKKKMFNVRAMSYMAMFIALEIVLEYVDKMWPAMPQGGSLSTALIAIFLASYLMGPIYGIMVGFCTSLLQFILGLATYYGIVSALMDYVLALGVCGLASCVPSIKLGKQEFPIGILVAMLIKFALHTIAGTVAFETPWIDSMIYNGPYNLITAVVCLILFMLLYPSLKRAIKLEI